MNVTAKVKSQQRGMKQKIFSRTWNDIHRDFTVRRVHCEHMLPAGILKIYKFRR